VRRRCRRRIGLVALGISDIDLWKPVAFSHNALPSRPI
jgi:hypothetical protein